jgi:phosphatidylglycerol lysyltransferase
LPLGSTRALGALFLIIVSAFVGLTLLKMGEEARVALEGFTLEGGHRKALRHTYNKLAQEGWRFEVTPRENVGSLLGELRVVSDSWLGEKNTREKRFSLGNFSEAYLLQTPVAVVRGEGGIAAFANLWLTATRDEFSIDLMRYSEQASARNA